MSYSKKGDPLCFHDSNLSPAGKGVAGRGAIRKTNNPPDSARPPQNSANAVFRAGTEEPPEQPAVSNNPATLIATARERLGQAYGLDRPLCKNELARLIGLQDGPGNMAAKIESGRANMSGPVRVVLGMLLAGHRQPAPSLPRPSNNACQHWRATVSHSRDGLTPKQ